MAETQQMLTGDGGDLFEGLGIDYSFLGDPAAMNAAADAENAGPGSLNGGNPPPFQGDQRLFEAELLGDKSGAPDGSGDMLAPLAFAFHGSPAGPDGVRYHAAPQHKHKRVRSNPDVLQHFAGSALASGVLDGAGNSATRPSIVLNSHMSAGLPPTMPIGPVEVSSPVGLGQHSVDRPGAGGFQEMDEFLQELSWSELPSDASPGVADAALPPMAADDSLNMSGKRENLVAYRAQRIQEGVNELKMKRKRPAASLHARHNSNPVDLLHNLDQFRMLAQQTKQQQQQMALPMPGVSPTGMDTTAPFVNPFGGFLDPSALAQQQQMQLQQQQQQQQQQHMMMGMPANNSMMNPMLNGNGMMSGGGGVVNGGQFGFQVPPQIASGAARSLHGRRSSMGSGMPPRSRRPVRSSGLSMDMSQMNLSFLAVPEEEFQQQLQQMNQEQQAPPSLGSGGRKKSAGVGMGGNGGVGVGTDEAGRKMYKCGRCGQPKVGHVCTMPDQRNNWSQVDLEVTKGLKVMRINCHILPVKSRWVPQHEDNV